MRKAVLAGVATGAVYFVLTVLLVGFAGLSSSAGLRWFVDHVWLDPGTAIDALVPGDFSGPALLINCLLVAALAGWLTYRRRQRR